MSDDDARRLLAEGMDPALKKKAKKHAASQTFESMASQWLKHQAYKPKTRAKTE